MIIIISIIEDDDNDTTARKAFEAVLRVSLLQPTSPKFNKFADDVRKRAKNDYAYEFFEGEEVAQLIRTLRTYLIFIFM